MQIKKFEAPTLQEALDTIKRELGPEAIILQTKKHKRGFGLMSRASVEITAAVSERSLQKKEMTEKKLPDRHRQAVQSLPAHEQQEVYETYAERRAQRAALQEQVYVGAPAVKGKTPRQATSTRYADIIDDPLPSNTAQPARGTGKSRFPFMNHGVVSSDQAAASAEVPGNRGSAAPSEMENEVRNLKRMIEEMKSSQDESSPSAERAELPGGALGTTALRDAFEQLTLGGVIQKYALALVRKVGFELGPERSQIAEEVLDQLAAEIMQTTETLSPLDGIQPRAVRGENQPPPCIALVGPTGVGKTTTLAKIASDALLKRGLKVGMINLDTYKVAAFDQLATYAKILNVPFRSAASPEDLRAALVDFQSVDLILIDTTGRSQRDPESLQQMQQLLSGLTDLRVHLLLSTVTRDAELFDMAKRFSIFRPQGIVFSKLDEATQYGAIYNVVQRIKLPLLYFTTGQRVPEDLEEASRERMAALLMDL